MSVCTSMKSLTLVSILILVSKSDPVCFETSALVQGDVYLENSLYSVTSTPSILDCAADCSSDSACLSFGFEPATHTCHLHTQDSETEMTEVKEKWFHSNIALWSKKLFRPCSDHVCQKGDRCMIHRVTMAPTCVKAKISLPLGYCQIPADLPNANISVGEEKEGSVRTYTCNHGYLDTSLDTTSGVTTCMTDRQWNDVQLNCFGPFIRMQIPSVPKPTFTPIPSATLRDLAGNTSTLIFLVRACKDSNFMLSETTSNDGYSITLGGWFNTLSGILQCLKCAEEVTHGEKGILSCEEFRPFWLSWEKGTISVGKGVTPPDRMFMEWKSPSLLTIRKVSISSHIRTEATWLFIPNM